MFCYIISLKLTGKRNYEPLHEAIKSYKTWSRILDSTWAIVTDKSAIDIREHLIGFLDENDSVFVVRSGVETAWNNVRSSHKWLRKNL